ncbi:Uncharacterised protein [Segatella copri]|nr:Uncharacterised protein [Segatella copri]
MVINGKFFCGTLERPQSYLKADAYRLALVPVVLHSEEYFSEFCEKVDEAIRNREHITLVIRDWGFDAIPLKYLSPFKSSVKSLSCVR